MKNYHYPLLIIIVFLFTSCCKLSFPLPDVKLCSKKVCGQNTCKPGNVGKLLHLTASPFSPAVEKANNMQEVVAQVLGRTLPADEIKTSKDFSTCSETSSNPFSTNDIKNIRFPNGREIGYEWSKDLKIDIKTATEANVKELMKMTSDKATIETLKSEIEAAYKRVKGKKLTVIGKYTEWELSQDAREKIKKGDGYQSCRKWIEDNNQRIITAVGIVYFEIKYEENSLDQLATDLDAALKNEGLKGSISFSFKREITKSLKANQEVFQILIHRHAGIKGKTLTF